jgi:hypothetical protein
MQATLGPSPSRLSSLLRLLVQLGLGVLLALPLACWQVGSGVSSEPSRSELAVAGALLECPVGAEGCPCTSGGGCDPGLFCMSGYCTSGGSGGDGGEVYYDFEEDVMLAPPAPTTGISLSGSTGAESRSTVGRKNRPAKERQKRGDSRNFAAADVAASAMAPEGANIMSKQVPVSATGTSTITITTPDERDPTDELDDDARQMIYTADLQVAVYELDAAIEFAESLPVRYGGWIESRYDYQITLRLPAERLFEAIEQLGALGLVLGKTLRADDVTDEFTDLESRILVLEQLVEQLELLLAKAKTVEEALKIRIELDRIRIELEAARVRMRQLSELIDFSTLTLYLSQRGAIDALPASNDPFPWVDDLGVETTEYR